MERTYEAARESESMTARTVYGSTTAVVVALPGSERAKAFDSRNPQHAGSYAALVMVSWYTMARSPDELSITGRDLPALENRGQTMRTIRVARLADGSPDWATARRVGGPVEKMIAANSTLRSILV
jgi:hypothetical protein